MNTQSILNQVKAQVDAGGFNTYDWESHLELSEYYSWSAMKLQISMIFKCPCGRPDARFYQQQHFSKIEMDSIPEKYIIDRMSQQIMHHFQAHIDGEVD